MKEYTIHYQCNFFYYVINNWTGARNLMITDDFGNLCNTEYKDLIHFALN